MSLAPRHSRLPTAVWFVALAFTGLELAVAARRPALGYVDQPPLAPLLTRITAVLGTNPIAVRTLPAVAGGLLVAGAAKLAGLFGGGRFAQILAAVATACAPVILGAAHLAGTTIFDLLAWTGVLLAVTTAIQTGRPRYWLLAGVTAGIGLEFKDLVLLLAASLVAGLLLTRRGAVLRTRWPWLAAGLAVFLWIPNLLWQVLNGWPLLTMAAILHSEHSSANDHVTVLPAQLLYVGILAAPVVVAGFIWLWRQREFRYLAVAALLLLAYVVIDIPGRPYYDDGLLPALFAGGAIAIERHFSASRRLSRGGWIAAPVVGALIALPITLPVLPQSILHDIPGLHKLNYDLRETVGWPEFTTAVANFAASMKRAGTPPTAIFTSNYGEASALLVFGSQDDLPPVISAHNNYWLWGPQGASDQVVLTIGVGDELDSYFGACRAITQLHAPDGVVNDEDGVVVGLCTAPREPWTQIWPSIRNFS